MLLHGTVAADPGRGAVDYEVLPGDTVSEIAHKFGVDVETVVRANGLRTADHIVPGQVLSILPVSGITYTVRPGDTLIAIANRYDVDPDAVLRWNGISDPDLIVMGTELILPGARPSSPPSAPAARTATVPQPAPQPVVTAPRDPAAPTSGSSFNAKITAYSHQAPVSGARGSTTRSGTPVRWGVLAVDPQIIPLGSRVMIEGFDDVFVAEDTGGAVRGPHVEIFYPDHAAAVRFGVQTRRVTILD